MQNEPEHFDRIVGDCPRNSSGFVGIPGGQRDGGADDHCGDGAAGAQLDARVAQHFRVVEEGAHITSPLEMREYRRSRVSTISWTSQTGAPAATSSFINSASSGSPPSRAKFALAGSDTTPVTPFRPASHMAKPKPGAARRTR